MRKTPSSGVGKVYLIGAGPGDPGLLTLRGRECIAKADVVVYDHLANEDLLSHARPGAEAIFVGKIGGRRTRPQGAINALLVEKARAGRIVARLKGGAPFIFGRGGEEAEELWRAGIPFEIVPGVTSAVAVPAYAGIPLTHREYASTVFFATGSEDSTKKGHRVAWDKVATGAGTIVIFMGVKTLAANVSRLVRHGLSPRTPAALIRWGTTPEQKTVVGTLGTIVRAAEQAGMKPPGIVVVGEVVRLREKLRWYETKPLFGRRVVVTRARDQAGGISGRLRDMGAEVVEIPAIEFRPPVSWAAADRALGRLFAYAWAVFTSATAVEFFMERLRARGRDIRELSGVKLCAIGPRTASALEGHGLRVDVVPGEYVAEAVVASLGTVRLRGARVLLPRARVARDVIPDALRARGARVDVVEVYRTVAPRAGADRIRRLLREERVHGVTFTSSSTVKNFISMIGPKNLPLLGSVRVLASIGPVTSETLRSYGLTPHVTGSSLETMISGLVARLRDS